MICRAGNTDAMQLLGGLLSVLPERVTKTMDAHREAITKKVCEGESVGVCLWVVVDRWVECRIGKTTNTKRHSVYVCVGGGSEDGGRGWGPVGGEAGGYITTQVGCGRLSLQQLVGWQASGNGRRCW